MLNLKNYTGTLIFLTYLLTYLLNSNGTAKTDGLCKKIPRKYTKLPHIKKRRQGRPRTRWKADAENDMLTAEK